MAQAPIPRPKQDRQVGKNKCSKHKKERLKRYCTTCKMPVCIDCMSEEPHSQHADKICKIDDVFASVEGRVIDIFDKVNKFKLDTIKPTLADVEKKREESRSIANITIQEINQRQEELKRQIDSATKNLVKKVEKVQKNYETDLNKTENALKDIRDGVVGMMTKADNVIQNGSKLDMLISYSELRVQYTEIPFLPNIPNINSARFIETPIDRKKVEKLVGEVQEPSIAQMSVDGDLVVNQFAALSDDPVDALVPLYDQVWVHEDGMDTVRLITLDSLTVGMELDVDIKIEDMARTNAGDIIITSSTDRCLRRLEGTTGEIFSFGEDNKKLIPKGLCVTGSKAERVVVCMVDADDDNPRPNSQRILQIFDVYGKKKKTIEYDNDGKRLFTNPKRVAVNHNGHYCVLDTNNLLIVHKDGIHLLNTYDGIQGESEFEPEHIICNNKGHLVVADSENRIHVLDSTGQLLYLITPSDKNICEIYSLANGIDGSDKIWIGCENGVAIATLLLDQDE